MGAVSRTVPIVLALAATALAAAPPALAGEAERGMKPATANPLRGLQLFVDHDFHPAWDSYRGLRGEGRAAEAASIFKIAREPHFRWFGEWEERIFQKTRRYLRKIDKIQPGAIPAITLFRHPHPKPVDPNQFGQRPDAKKRWKPPRGANKRALAWIRRFASAIGDRRVVIAFEPDSLGSQYLLSKKGQKERIAYMKGAIDILSKLPNATIYAEGGASDWRTAKETAGQLKKIGVHKIRGFMLNVTHFDTTKRSLAHGLKISRRLGGKPFVISTHANGKGPIHYIKRFGCRNRRVNVWCNPKNSALGERPQTSTSNPKVDAYLWIGRAGYSAGTCKGSPGAARGGPRPGFWWEERGILLAQRSPARFDAVREPLRFPTAGKQ